jgi:hypothetical protein
MNLYFIILIILILTVIYFLNDIINFNIKEPFCTKKSSDKCLNHFTYAYEVAGGQALGIKNYSVNPSTNTTNPNEKIMNYQCVPNNYPNETGGTDCNIFPSMNAMNNARNNAARDWFKNPNYYLDCKQIGKSLPGCATGYNQMGYKSYSDLGYSCNVGSGLIPTKIDTATGIITCATDSNGNCLVRSSKTDCVNSLNLIPLDNSNQNTNKGMACTNGAVGTACVNMYNTLGLKTLDELGYSCNSSIGKGNLPGKVINNSTYNFASYDNKTIVNNCPTAINFQPLNELKDVVCSEYTISTDPTYPTACEQAYTNFNLYPSTNPLVNKGNDPNYTIGETYNTPTSLFNIYSTYQQAFPEGTNSNSAQSIANGIETILSETPLKLACCRRSSATNNTAQNVSVRVPVNPTIESINPNVKKFNFQYSQINIPPNSCPANLYSGSTDCDNFFGLNCNNIINYMDQQNIDVQSELINYAPECACYAPQTQAQQGYPPSTPAVCYKNGCDITSNPSVYLDPNSRDGDSQKTCSLTICNSINDFSGMTVGGGANISTRTQNQCGSSQGTSPSSDSGTTQSSDSGTTQSSDSGTTQSSDSNNNTVLIIVIVLIILLSCSSSIYFFMKKK